MYDNQLTMNTGQGWDTWDIPRKNTVNPPKNPTKTPNLIQFQFIPLMIKCFSTIKFLTH